MISTSRTGLKFSRTASRWEGVRIRRLEQVTQTERASLRLHDEITIISGLGPLGREALALELIGALGNGRPGLSADLSMMDGRCINVHRPLVGRPTAVDPHLDADRSDGFQVIGSTSIDPLSALGIDRHRHRHMIRLGRAELQRARLNHERIGVLASANQSDVWNAAEQLGELDERVRSAVAGAREVDDESHANEQAVEQSHANVDTLIDRGGLDDVELVTSVVALAVMGIGATVLSSVTSALPFFAVAAGLCLWRQHHRRALANAQTAERAALHASGVDTYLDHQLRQVDGLTGSPQRRAETLTLIERRQHELDRWSHLLGDREDITPRWALDHRGDVADLLSTDEATLAASTNANGDPGALARHLSQTLELTDEPLPLLLDDPFGLLDDFDLAAVLAMLDDASETNQIIVLTDDPRIVGWGKHLESDRRALVIHLGGEADFASQRQPLLAPILDLV